MKKFDCKSASCLFKEGIIMKKRVLVLGATGVLGRPVARKLREDGFQVRIMTRNLEKA